MVGTGTTGMGTGMAMGTGVKIWYGGATGNGEGGAECGLQKLQNGIGVFHYVG